MGYPRRSLQAFFSPLKSISSLLFFLLISSSCSSSPDRTDGITFKVNLGTEPPSLDWSIATDHVSFNVIANLMVGLTEFDRSLKPTPVVAKSWEMKDAGKTILFHLRDDVLWSDGKKVRAQEFEYSWKRLLDPQTASEYAYILFDIVNAKPYNQGEITDAQHVGVRALDDRTLEVRLNNPAPYFLAITTFEVTYPQRRDIIEKHGARWTEPGNIVINGPFLLDSWVHESEIRLKANPRFFLGRPHMDRIEMVMVNEKTTALAMYERGQLDFIDNKSIPILEKKRLSDEPGFREVSQLRGYYYGFNTRHKPFDDVRVRRAFAMAVDREIFPKILHGGELPASSWIPPGMPAHNKEIGLAFNPAEAKRLLAEAGYPEGKGFPQVYLGYNTDETHKLVAEAMQGIWERHLGIVVRLDNQEWKVYLHRLRTDPPLIFRLGWGADYPDPNNFMKLFTSTSGNNNTRWESSRFDELITKAARELDENKRVQLYNEAQRILCEIDVPIIPLFVTSETTVLNRRFSG
ncbi:MAG: peptide ABC transporter substrate-binding protein, partial [Candidatus Binatia bacterium]|nr:peptide ABC transporter substrate-binding protein [Candidatus Binatia bacterium]